MELESVGRLLVYVVLGLLALDRGWSLATRPPPLIKEVNGKLGHLEEEIEKLHRDRIHATLTEILTWAKDIHEDIDALKTENTKVHAELVKTLIDTKE